ncbi:MAG TPA: S-layer homology domain-containing protein, partial [Chloroflexia bacterium]|nr:S-layer homology domain-containing protein [Chloroflexia bacterium]
MNILDTAGSVPPDTNGDVGVNQYVQMVNSSIEVYNKNGTVAYAPREISSIWAGTGTPCATRDDGDPIVLYDQLAGRWLISQFTATAPYYECIAISASENAGGAYWRYSFLISNTNFPDYPHFGMWPDGYYMGVNQYNNHQAYSGGRPYVFERAKMLLGQPATMQSIAAPLPLATAHGLVMPADLEGRTAPPAGAPNYFWQLGMNNASINVYKYHVDWTTPANSTWTGPINVPVAGFTRLCTSDCIPQKGTSQKLNGVGDRPMFRASYRNFSGQESLVINHSVQATVGANQQAGVRWYEVGTLIGTPSIRQQGTIAYADGHHRWLGSAAIDRDRNIAVGYSVSSASLYPSILYSGRLASDPLGIMGQGEAIMFLGDGSQVGADRWGDYSDLTVDPVDDCTFWYTNQVSQYGGIEWETLVGAFKFPSCGTGPTVTPIRTNTPIPPSPTRTATRTATRTNTPVAPSPTRTAIRTATRTNTPIAASPTRTATRTATRTSTPIAASPTRTRTAIPPSPTRTATRTSTPRPTQTPGGATATRVSTNTPVPPTATRTRTAIPPSPTRTATRTNTAIPPSATRTSTPRPTQTPGGSTATAEPSATNTPIVEPTVETPIPTETPGIQTCNLQFSDVPEGSTFYSFVRCLACRGILGGYSDNTFRPGNNVTRGQLSKIVSNAAGFTDEPGAQMFEDVPATNSFFAWVQRLASRGFISGYPCGGANEPCGADSKPYFRPNNTATRGQISKIVSNSAGFNDRPSGQLFEDIQPTNSFYAWVQRLASRGYIGGYPCGGANEPCGASNLPYFRPNNNATRGQVSKIVANTFFPNCETPAGMDASASQDPGGEAPAQEGQSLPANVSPEDAADIEK